MRVVLVVVLSVMLAGCAQIPADVPAAPVSDTGPSSAPPITPVATPSPPLTPQMTSPVPTPPTATSPSPPASAPPAIDPQAPACDLQRAKLLHREYANGAFDTGTLGLRGVKNDERLDITISVDATRDLLYVRDGIENQETVSRGRIVASLGSDSYQWRHDGSTSFTDGIMAPESEEGTSTASVQPEAFEVPTSWFSAECTSFRGSPSLALSYEEHELYEVWIFDAASGDVLQAIHVNNLTNTNLIATYTTSVSVPQIDATLPRLPGTIRLIEIFAGDGNKPNEYLFREVLDEETEPLSYEDLRIVLYSEAGEELEDLPLSGVTTGQYGSVRLLDSGQLGITDPGDEWQITLAPYADSWDVWDGWAGDWADTNWTSDAASTSPDAAPASPDEGAPVTSATISRHYKWSYDGQEWTWDLEIPQSLYDYYVDAPFVYENGDHAFDIYVSTPYDDEFIQSLANALLDAGRDEGWSDDDILSFALAFVQSLPYTSDDVTTGYDEYPRYPAETLVDNGGDCEDTSILYASIVLAMGYDAVMVGPPGHMAVGVAAEDDVAGTGYTYQGRRYLFAETTGDGFAIGDIPPSYEGERVTIYDLNPKAVIEHTWSIGEEQLAGYQHAVLEVTNTGSAPASNAELWIGIELDDGRVYDADSCQFPTLHADKTVTCTVWLELPPTGARASVHFIVAAQPSIYQESMSAHWIV